MMIHPHPRSNLFPYTTLFRSERDPARRRVHTENFDDDGLVLIQDVLHAAHALGGQLRDVDQAFEDRKSTRLNSSHRCISYAVFCLKKKKHSIITQIRVHY